MVVILLEPHDNCNVVYIYSKTVLQAHRQHNFVFSTRVFMNKISYIIYIVFVCNPYIIFFVMIFYFMGIIFKSFLGFSLSELSFTFTFRFSEEYRIRAADDNVPKPIAISFLFFRKFISILMICKSLYVFNN